jgi:hypothetical protein
LKKIIFEERGYFWWNDLPIPAGRIIPNAPVSGLLRIDEEGRIELKLDAILPHPMGIFVAFSEEEHNKIRKKCIQGILKGSDKYILLSGLSMNGGNIPSGGIAYHEFIALTCIVGDSPFLADVDMLQTKNIEINLKGLEGWFRLGSIFVNRSNTNLTVKHKKIKDVTYQIDKDKIILKHRIYGPHLGKSRRRELLINETVSLIYKLAKNISINEVKNTFGWIEDLFILLTGSDYCLEWPIISLGKNKNITLYFTRHKSYAPAPNWYECVTNFIQLQEKFGEIFSAWKNKREIFGPGFYLYLGTRRGIQLYIEHRFVNLVWGIESFHRKKTGSEPPRALDKKVKRILDQMGQVLKSDDKKWLAKKLENASDPRLQDRIFETFKTLPIALNGELLKEFAKNCADRRNDISHYGGQRQDGAYDEFAMDLNNKCDALSTLYHLLLLQEIGIEGRILNHWLYEGSSSYRMKISFVEVGLLEKSSLDQEADPQLSSLPDETSDKNEGAAPGKRTITLSA